MQTQTQTQMYTLHCCHDCCTAGADLQATWASRGQEGDNRLMTDKHTWLMNLTDIGVVISSVCVEIFCDTATPHDAIHRVGTGNIVKH